MLYHTTDSPSYKQTIAEVWFREESGRRTCRVHPVGQGPGARRVRRRSPTCRPVRTVQVRRKPGADGSGPSGWTVKGNEDSMLYHSPESPAYDVTVAEVWFRDEETAEAAGFSRWDSGKSQRGQE